jgi:NAD-dependent DNA ligase
MSRIRGKSYKNCRNAIIGLLGSSDAYNFIQFITLIPLATSLDLDRITELKFLNMYYNSGEYNRYVTMQGNYQQILFQVKQFVESAEIARSILPYMIDGVVISFTDPEKIKALGRVNSVNKYSMAIKFNPKKVRTIFLNYTYNIGKSGEVIPMVHFKPCEFIGAIHEKQTIHSYQRFKDLNLAKGDQIDVEYVNDVISYVTKPDNEFNRNNRNEPEEFIKVCPFCGTPIEISGSGKSARCPNPNCHERQIMRMIDMMNRLGFKDFSDSWVRTLDLTTLRQLLTQYTLENTRQYGDLSSQYFIQQINMLKTKPIYDYRIMAALSFDGMADETWKIVLSKISIADLITQPGEWIKDSIHTLPGIGPKTINAILEGVNLYKDDIECALSILHIIESKSVPKKPRVAITGFRDEEFINLINGHGFDCSDTYSVTKNTVALIADTVESTSSKAQKARQYEIPIFTKDSFLRANGKQI